LIRVGKILSVLAALFLLVGLGFAQSTISAEEAKSHLGEKASVCGLVVGARYASGSRGNPTFINLDKAYPNQIFTIVIWGSDRQKFGNPESTYSNKRVCVTGKITDYKRVPEIAAYEPTQIRIQ
jgi:hypothetical protein